MNKFSSLGKQVKQEKRTAYASHLLEEKREDLISFITWLVDETNQVILSRSEPNVHFAVNFEKAAELFKVSPTSFQASLRRALISMRQDGTFKFHRLILSASEAKKIKLNHRRGNYGRKGGLSLISAGQGTVEIKQKSGTIRKIPRMVRIAIGPLKVGSYSSIGK